MTTMSNGFATLDRSGHVDETEGTPDKFTIEFRDAEGGLIDRVRGTRQACVSEAGRRGYYESGIRVTGRAAKQ